MATIATGIDIGHSHLRAVVVRLRGERPVVQHWASASRYNDDGSRRPLTLAIAELQRRCPFKGRIYLGISDAQVLVRFIPTVPMAEDRLARLLRLELSEQADASGDLAADTFVVPVAGDELIHCCCIAQAGQLKQLLKELAAADLRPHAVHLQSAALGNTFRPAERIDDDAFALVVDMGAKTTRVVLRRGNELLACRELTIGGDQFSEGLAKELDISFEEAEKQKCSSGLTGPESASNASVPLAAASDDDDDSVLPWLDAIDESEHPPSQASETIDTIATDSALTDSADPAPQPPSSEPLFAESAEDDLFAEGASDDLFAEDKQPPTQPAWKRHEHGDRHPKANLEQPGAQTMVMVNESFGPETRRVAEQLTAAVASSLTWFRSQLKLRQINLAQVQLCGGGSKLPGIARYLQRRLQANVVPLDPFHALDSGPEEDRRCYAAALGLALSSQRGAIALDLHPESMQRQRIFRSRIVFIYASAVAVLLAAAILMSNTYLQQRFHQSEQTQFSEHQARYQALKDQLGILSQRRDQLATDVRGIASRIYAGRDLLYVIRSLKQAAEEHNELWVAEFRTEGLSGTRENRTTNRGGGRGGRGGNQRNETPSHVDTSIDRGRLFVRVIIRREEGRDAARYERIFRDWLAGIMAWQRPDGGGALFRDYQQTEVPNLSDRHEYEVRFDFRPTSLSALDNEEQP